MNNKKVIIPVVLLVLVIAVVGLLPTLQTTLQATIPPTAVALPTATPVTPTTVTCFIGSEKQPLLSDPDVTKIMADKYQLTVVYKTKGSMDQVTLPADQLKDTDCLWPSNISASLLYQRLNPSFKGSPVPVLYSVLVAYVKIEARDVLVKQGYAEKRGDQYFIIKMNELDTNVILAGKTWTDLGASTLKGPIKFQSTDGGKSNSGFLTYALHANIAGGDAYTPASIDKASTILPAIKKLKDLQGLQFAGSEDVFNNWFSTRGFSAPMLMAYESQILEKSVTDPDGIKSNYGSAIYMMYPEPTVQSVHVIIPLTSNAQRLIQAMQDPDIQAIAWKKHGFRSLTGASNDPAAFPLVSVPQNVVTTDLPSVDMIQKLLDCLRDNLCQ